MIDEFVAIIVSIVIYTIVKMGMIEVKIATVLNLIQKQKIKEILSREEE